MPGSGTCSFIDADDYQESLNGTPLDLVLTVAQGEFSGRATSAKLHHLYLFRGEEDFPRIAYISLAPTLVFVGFVARGSRPMVWDGVELQPGEIVLHSPAERFHQWTAGSCGWSLIGLAPVQLQRYSKAVVGKAVRMPPGPRILRPAARNSARLLSRHAQACRLAETRPKMLAHSEVARALEQGIIQALMTCLQTTRIAGNELARLRHRRIMIRFEEVLAEQLSRPLSIQQLCGLIGAKDRALRSCCTEFLGVSPTRYVLLRRLKQARVALREADPATTTVAEIAHACGFTELGRFAGVYRNAFGEIPSATLYRLARSG
jgi:AraC-like DNA-binding protein